MPVRNNGRRRPGVYNTPAIRNGGFGALQVEAVTNRPLSIARRHLAASVLRIRDIEPDELSSSEWVQFLVMEEQERERWITGFLRQRRRGSDESTSSSEGRAVAYDKAEEARLESSTASPPASAVNSSVSALPSPAASGSGNTPLISIWAREFDLSASSSAANQYSLRRPMHVRRAVTESIADAPPTYETAVRPRTPPPAYEARGQGDAGEH